MLSPIAVWNDFKFAFRSALDEVEPARLEKAWQDVRAKTFFYEWELMPAIGAKLGCQMTTERFRCDYTFIPPDGIPIAFVESENAHQTANREVADLCCWAAPLKALVISCEWCESEKDVWLPVWCDIIRKHHSNVRMDCLYAIVVGTRGGNGDDLFRYYFTLLNTTGEVIEESKWEQKTVSAITPT